MPAIPFNPEPLAALRARYPLALEHIYDIRDIVERGAIRPGEVAANVFMFEDGLRLIISRERDLDGRLALHFSASFEAKSHTAEAIRLLRQTRLTPRQIRQKWIESIPARFAELSGDDRLVYFLGVTDANIPHWIIRED